jgi:hypothetical protein
MYLIKHDDKIFELAFGECSRIICSDNKREDDEVKLWREANDGMCWVKRACRPEKNQNFSIIGVQVAGIILLFLFNLLLFNFYNYNNNN